MNQKQEIKNLAEKLCLDFDGGEDTRLFVPELIHVAVHLMTREEYIRMERELGEFTIEGLGFTVYAWNDASGYEYWKKQSKTGDFNYIQITVDVTDISKVNETELMQALNRANNKFAKWNNIEEYYAMVGE